MRVLGLAAAAMLLATPAAAQEGTDGVDAFVRQVYALYNVEDGPWPIDDRVLDRFWTPRMATLIRRDRELSVEDLPYLDADPICNCQDAGEVVVQGVEVGMAQANIPGRPVTVRFTNFGETTTTVLRLVREQDGWRIADVINTDGYPGLAEALAASNARIEAGGPALGRD